MIDHNICVDYSLLRYRTRGRCRKSSLWSDTKPLVFAKHLIPTCIQAMTTRVCKPNVLSLGYTKTAGLDKTPRGL